MKRYLLGLLVITGLILIPTITNSSVLTLYQCYQSKGVQWESIKERAVMAAEYGIWNYRGKADQNNKLSNILCPSGEPTLGYSVVTGYRSSLSLPMTASQTSVPVSSIATKDGHTLNMGDIGAYVFLTLEPGGVKEEIVKCTTISGGIFTGCTRGLAFYGTSTIAVAANAKGHNASSVVVMSNVHYVYEEMVDKDQAETIAGVKTFSSYPLISGSDSASTDRQLITFGQVNSIANQGAATSTETNAGISELATQIEMASSTQFDIYNPHVINSEYATSSPYAGMTGLYVPVTKNNGKLEADFIDQTENYTWSGTNSFTGLNTFTATTTMATTTMTSSTINNLNSSTVTSTVIDAGSLCFDGAGCATDMTSLLDTVTSTEAGIFTPTTTDRTINEDYVVTTNFKPKFVEITYYIRGYGDVGAENANYGQTGTALFNANGTLVSNNPIIGGNGTSGASGCNMGDSGVDQPDSLDCFLHTNPSTNLSVGNGGAGNGDIQTTISVPSVTASGFTFRCAFVTGAGDPVTANHFGKCRGSWKAYR